MGPFLAGRDGIWKESDRIFLLTKKVSANDSICFSKDGISNRVTVFPKYCQIERTFEDLSKIS